MRNPNSFGVHFHLRLERSQNNRSQVYLRITVNKKRSEVAMSCFLSRDDWNVGKGAAKPKSEKLRQLNTYLEEVRGKVIFHYQQLSLKGVTTSTAVKTAFLGMNPEMDRHQMGLLELVETHNKEAETVMKRGTIKNYYTTAAYVRKFLAMKFPAGELPLKSVNFRLISEFELYIRNNPIKAFDPCGNNGTMKHMERLKKIIIWAIRNEWMEKNPFNDYRMRYKRKEMEFLSKEELDRIQAFDFKDPILQLVRDLFVFSCYTGLPYSDLIDLKTNNIVLKEGGQKWLETARRKTNVPIRMPLLTPASVILAKYEERDGIRWDDLFPWVSNQAMNKSLKVIGELCGISKHLTFHIARHTFATTVTLENNVPIETISKLLGHTKITTTMIYAKVIQTKIGQDMNDLQNKLDKKNHKIGPDLSI
jgi:site-specific recombinase XerD